MAHTYDHIGQVVDDGLCVRCGTCIAACPKEAIVLDEELYPRIEEGCDRCGLCVRVCPGWDVDVPRLLQETFRVGASARPPEGHYERVLVACATDSGIREAASGGGVVTGLLSHLLRSGEIQGAVVVGMNAREPWRAEAFLARTEDEIRGTVQSKYTMVPANAVLRDVRSGGGRFAVVALPCQAQGLRKLLSEIPSWRERIACIIGLYCHLNLEQEATTTLLGIKGFRTGDVEKLEYRGGPWPGRIRAARKGEHWRYLHAFDIKDGALNYLKRCFTVPRCFTCIDGAVELGDLSVADAWIRNRQGGWLFDGSQGWSIVVERTPTGQRLLGSAVSAGALETQELAEGLILSAHRAMLEDKKKGAAYRIARGRRSGRPVPEYHLTFPRLGLKEILGQRLYLLSLWPSRWRFVRRLLTTVAFSRPGALFTGAKCAWKARRVRKSVAPFFKEGKG